MKVNLVEIGGARYISVWDMVSFLTSVKGDVRTTKEQKEIIARIVDSLVTVKPL